MTDKTQRLSCYKSAHGIMVYEIEQYHKGCDDWFIVGDSSTNYDYMFMKVYNHNEQIKYTHEWVNANIPF